MSIIGFHFTSSLLNVAGWPKRRGLLRRPSINSSVADRAIDQMINWAASLGAGRPHLALRVIAEIFRDRNWDAANRPDIKQYCEMARAHWDRVPDATPVEIVKPTRLSETFGPFIKAKEFAGKTLAVAMENYLRDAILWGLTNPGRLTDWYTQLRASQIMLKAQHFRDVGVDVPPAIEEWFGECAAAIDQYESDIGPLSAIPPRLRRDAQDLGVALTDSASEVSTALTTEQKDELRRKLAFMKANKDMLAKRAVEYMDAHPELSDDEAMEVVAEECFLDHEIALVENDIDELRRTND